MSIEAMKLAIETAEGIANANWREWQELASPEEFERWAKSRANHMATALRQAIEQAQKQEPVDIDELCAKHNKIGYKHGYRAGKADAQCKPLTREVIERDFYGRVDFVRQVEAAIGIKGEA